MRVVCIVVAKNVRIYFVYLGKVMQTVKARKVSLEKVEAALPGINASKLVTVSRAINDENNAVSTFSATAGPTHANCEYFINFICDVGR